MTKKEAVNKEIFTYQDNGMNRYFNKSNFDLGLSIVDQEFYNHLITPLAKKLINKSSSVKESMLWLAAWLKTEAEKLS